jgi:hypothetical protein
MKTKQLIAVLALTAATGAVFAQSTTGSESLAPKTRAEVIAQLQQASAQGQLLTSYTDYPFTVASNTTSVSRADVKADVAKAQRSGQLLVSSSDYPFKPTVTENKTRAEVKAELRQARNTGDVEALRLGLG